MERRKLWALILVATLALGAMIPTAGATSAYDQRDAITFGLVAAQSGANKTIGQFVTGF